MGAGASTHLLYKDALIWFRQYFDADKYVEDFHTVDTDHDQGISLIELKKWIQFKASTEGGPWKMVISHLEILTIAHEQAVKSSAADLDPSLPPPKQVDLEHFRLLLMQLFAISIFWVHFKKADQSESSQKDKPEQLNSAVENEQLDRSQFRHAVRTFCAVYGQEEVSEEQLDKDFDALDIDNSGTMSFSEVCTFCCRFADPKTAEKVLASLGNPDESMGPNEYVMPKLSVKTPVFSSYLPITDSMANLNKYPTSPADTHTKMAMEVMGVEIERNRSIADLAELKRATEKILEQSNVILSPKSRTTSRRIP